MSKTQKASKRTKVDSSALLDELVDTLRSVPTLPKDAAKRLDRMKPTDWTTDDWRDLLAALRWIRAVVAARHGFLEPIVGKENHNDG